MITPSDDPADPEMIGRIEAWLMAWNAGDHTRLAPEVLDYLRKHQPVIARGLEALMQAPRTIAKAELFLTALEQNPELN